MNLLIKLRKVDNFSLSKIATAIFLLLHILLFNINVAEWGDSYRILRAAEFLRNFSYPLDEKRPPLFSGILAIRPLGVDQVFWGRLIVLVFSLASFCVFNKLIKLLLKEECARGLALLIFALNPVYLYWSIRIMADVPFSFLVLLVIYLYTKWHSFGFRNLNVVILGVVVGLSILMRFEGYVLFGAVGLGLLFTEGYTLLRLPHYVLKNFSKIFSYVFSVAVIILPYLYFRNPFGSSYLEEPSGRAYDFRMVWIYAVSLLFLFGFTFAFYFLSVKRDVVLEYFKNNVVISAFVFVELLLILFWPAAVPRLFVAVIPLLIIPLAEILSEGFDRKIFKTKLAVVSNLILIGIFAVSQYFLKLQFLVSIRFIFILLLVVQFILLYALLVRHKPLFITSLGISMAMWSFSSIWIHKDIFAAVQAAASYASTNLSGVMGYNDVSSVSDWYLNQKGSNDVTGVFFPYGQKEQLDHANLLAKGFDYILMTNEHNTDTTLDIEKRPYLEEVREFKRIINGKEFWTKIIKVSK